MAEAADAAFAGHDTAPNALLRVTHELELGWRPLGDDHPLDLLLGFVAPEDWLAIGVTCWGRARSLDPDTAASPDDDPERARVRGKHVGGDSTAKDEAVPVRITLLVVRSGAAAATLRRDGAPRRLAEPPDGAVADACRRALQLPTAPAPGNTAELWTLWWLDRLVATAVEPGSGGLLGGWAQVAAQHPAAWLPVSGQPSGRQGRSRIDAAPDGSIPAPGGQPWGRRHRVGPEPDVLAAASQALADAWPWTRLRTDPDAPEIPGASPGPQVTAWMDDGMYARWLLASFPSCRDLLDATTAVLPSRLAQQVQAVVAATLASTSAARHRDTPRAWWMG